MHIALPASYLGADLAGRYRLERLVGDGATALVFAARDLRLQREVAVKLFKPRAESENIRQRRRFVHEGCILAKLTHQHVVAVYDVGETIDGLGYLVMELSKGGTLEAELRRRPRLAVDEALQLLVPVLGALACAHDRRIIHRDLKPANIVLAQDGRKLRAKVLDFGIAKHADMAGSSSGAFVGTPAYMAPEQARGQALGPTVDVWGMGVILFRCLTGQLPFDADSPAALLLKLVAQRAPEMRSVVGSLPPHVALAIDRALEPEPKYRYQDMRAFARVLAIACKQDGVLLEAQPEPIGLPDFAAWLEEANTHATGDSQVVLTSALQVPQTPASTADPSRGLGARTASFRLAVAIAVALCVALWARDRAAAPVGRSMVPRAPSGGVVLADQPEPSTTASLEVSNEPGTHPGPLPSLPPPASARAPSDVTSVRIVRTDARGRTRESKKAVGHQQSKPPAGAQRADAQTGDPGLIVNWEW